MKKIKVGLLTMPDGRIYLHEEYEQLNFTKQHEIAKVLEETGLTVGKCRYCGVVTFVSDVWETEYMHIFHTTDYNKRPPQILPTRICSMAVGPSPSLQHRKS